MILDNISKNLLLEEVDEDEERNETEQETLSIKVIITDIERKE